jgi:hypothetical protein
MSCVNEKPQVVCGMGATRQKKRKYNMSYEVIRNILIILVSVMSLTLLIQFGIDLYNLSNLGVVP